MRLLLALVVVAASAALAGPALAINYGHGTYGGCQYGSCSIMISSSGSVSLDVSPSASGKCTIQSDDVSVLTDNSEGYTLTGTTAGTNTALLNGGNSIAASSASQSSPASLGADRWGYRVDGLAGFGTGPTTAVSNHAPDSTPFAGMPASNATPDLLGASSVKANPAVSTTVWYGLCADTSAASGSYTTQVTYSAVTN
jgi:hypothetical protein